MTRVLLSELTKTYPGTAAPALDRLTLDVPSGELIALLGPSGCGKTTTMKMIAGLLEPTSGDITFDGRSILWEKPENRGVVMVFQNYLLFPYMSVADNVGFGLRMRKVPKDQIAARVTEMLALVKLPDLGRRRPSELSGGQQQRVALARALIVQPKVLLLDEPLSNLDAHLRIEMRDLIRGIQKDLGITTIFVTHDHEEAVVLADRVALILNGQLRQYEVPDAFYRRPADAEVAAFFGGKNVLPGVSAHGTFDGPLGRLTLPDGARPGPGLLTFRPESVRIGPAPVNALKARVSERLYLGSRTRLRLTVGETVVDAVLSPDLVEGIRPGDEITINLPPGSLWIMAGTR
ncbi:MAG: ABC transporter ATP-binding protein [Rhodobacterales bacterium]|nr:ABC transporter ATP-binding protein [Rhodobacterales bacterium]